MLGGLIAPHLPQESALLVRHMEHIRPRDKGHVQQQLRCESRRAQQSRRFTCGGAVADRVRSVKVRVTGIMVEGDRLLLLRQQAGPDRAWSLPGGRVEEREPLAVALAREMREETGLEIEVGRLLYLCDHLPDSGTHVVHVTFEVRRVGGVIGDLKPGADSTPILGIEFVDIDDLPDLGFTERFRDLVQAGFPDAGSYAGPKSVIGL